MTDAGQPAGIRELPDLGPPAIPPGDTAAKEEQAILTNQYQQDEQRQRHRRTQGVKNVAYWACVILVWFGVILLMVAAAIWMIHIAGPHCWRWLTPDEIEKLQGLLFSGALSATLTLIGKKIFS